MASGAPAPSSTPAGGLLGKGGKVKVEHDKSRAAAVAVSEAYLEKLKKSHLTHATYSVAQLVLEVNGIGYIGGDGKFSEAHPEATSKHVKTATRTSADTYRPQFIITVGFGPGFSKQMCVVVSNPVFFKGGDATSERAKLVGGHSPILVPQQTYVFSAPREGAATYTAAMGFRGETNQQSVVYNDMVAFLSREEAKEDGGWIKSKLLRME